jgi:putative phosphoribosyl transferase
MITRTYEVEVPVGDVTALAGTLTLPDDARGIVLFAHGSGSSRHSPRNQRVARFLQRQGLGTLMFDLLSATEEAAERLTHHLRFDIALLAGRVAAATAWIVRDERARGLGIGYFGASTGAAAALVAAAVLATAPVQAVVSRGGRPDLAGDYLERVFCPTLLIVGGDDVPVIDSNWEAFERLRCDKKLEIVPGATHLFEEFGALDAVSRLAADWFSRHLHTRVAEQLVDAPI